MDSYILLGIVGIVGLVFFALSFILPERKKNKEEEKETEERIRAFVTKELEGAKERIDDMVEETVNYSVEKTERALEKMSNEKIMAVDEYSETVLEKINANHNEAVFLYDMLNDKDEKLKNTEQELIKEKEKTEEVKKEIEKKQAEVIAKAEEAEAETEPVKEPEFRPFMPEQLVLRDGVAIPKAEASSNTSEKKPATTKKKKAEPKKNSVNNVSLHFDTDNDGKKNSNEMIRKLHEQGKSNMAIAKELGLGVGEVKLVIDLFASKK
ncbi:MAG: hypothetical protein J6U37_06325 [Lachnospiraceae bacterium]|nr:hypothetical protein [Lachnospiraceae bacterium]